MTYIVRCTISNNKLYKIKDFRFQTRGEAEASCVRLNKAFQDITCVITEEGDHEALAREGGSGGDVHAGHE